MNIYSSSWLENISQTFSNMQFFIIKCTVKDILINFAKPFVILIPFRILLYMTLKFQHFIQKIVVCHQLMTRRSALFHISKNCRSARNIKLPVRYIIDMLNIAVAQYEKLQGIASIFLKIYTWSTSFDT